jgi:transposase
MRRLHLRGHTNIRKRLLVHAGAFNLGLLMRQLIGVGTPRGLQGRLVGAVVALVVLIRSLWESMKRPGPFVQPTSQRRSTAVNLIVSSGAREMAFTTGC